MAKYARTPVYGPPTYRRHLNSLVDRVIGSSWRIRGNAAVSRYIDRRVVAAQRRRYAMQVASRFPQPVTDRIMDFMYARR